MVTVAQVVERLAWPQKVGGSNPLGHPTPFLLHSLLPAKLLVKEDVYREALRMAPQ